MLVLILLVLGVRGCLDARKERAFRDYARDVSELVNASNQQSEALFDLLRDSGGAGDVDIEQSLNSFAVEAEQLVDRARDGDAPDDLKPAKDYLVQALELRRDGTRGIAAQLRTALGDEGRSEAVARIAAQMQFFLASDVIYSQRVIPRLQEPLDEEGVLDEVEIPRSQFLPDLDWLEPTTVADVVLRNGGGGGRGTVAPGLHGTGLTGVTAQPSGQALQPGQAIDLKAGSDLAFDVKIANQGENEEKNVVVSVTISGAGKPIELEEKLDTIAAGEEKTVRVAVADAPPTGRPVTIEVEIKPVPGEEKTDNNSGSFPAIFTR